MVATRLSQSQLPFWGWIGVVVVSFVNVPNATESYTSKWLLLRYMNVMSITNTHTRKPKQLNATWAMLG